MSEATCPVCENSFDFRLPPQTTAPFHVTCFYCHTSFLMSSEIQAYFEDGSSASLVSVVWLDKNMNSLFNEM